MLLDFIVSNFNSSGAYADIAIFQDHGHPTLSNTNIAPERMPSQKERNLPTIHFQVLSWFYGVHMFMK